MASQAAYGQGLTQIMESDEDERMRWMTETLIRIDERVQLLTEASKRHEVILDRYPGDTDAAHQKLREHWGYIREMRNGFIVLGGLHIVQGMAILAMFVRDLRRDGVI